jgi:ATP-dependent DNA helicase RecQ
LQEVIAYAETSMSRRQYLLHYFGEEWDPVNGEGAGMDDNSRSPKEQFDGSEEVKMILECIAEFKELHKAAFICKVIAGIKNSEVTTYKGNQSKYFGEGKEHDEKFWNAIVRQMYVRGLVAKEVETYGTLKITAEGKDFMKKPQPFMVVKEVEIGETDDEDLIIPKQGGGAVDETLFKMLKDLRQRMAKEKGIPPYVVVQDPAMEEMCTQYPITLDEIAQIGGVGKGKAQKFGQPFIDLIKNYVEENDIERPIDFVVKSTGTKSLQKVQIIQNIDKRIPLPDIAKGLGKSMGDLITELETIVSSGTKLNIQYFIDEELDDDQQDEIMEYFMQSETDEIRAAEEYFDGDYEEEPLRLMRIKFMSEVGN